MARPSQSVNVTSKHLTKEEIERRESMEKKLKGKNGAPKPPEWLTQNQKKIFNIIVRELKHSEMLCKLDVWILQECAITIDSLERIERDIISTPDIFYSKEIISAKDKYTRILFRCCNELCLSPQARAKIANAAASAVSDNTEELRKILSGEFENSGGGEKD